jgi:hypothetical protein
VAPPCTVDVRPGLEARQAEPVDLDDLVLDFAPDVVHAHNLMNPAVLEWAASRRDALLTVQDHRFFCPTRGKWTLAGEVCRRPMMREVCASCFEDQAYFPGLAALRSAPPAPGDAAHRALALHAGRAGCRRAP